MTRRPKLRVFVGCPASGKSTYGDEHAAELGTVLSLDSARALLGRGEHDQEATSSAVEWVRRAAADCLLAGTDVTIDATGAVAADRAGWIAFAAQHDAEPVAILFRIDLELAHARNAGRSRVVPAEVLTDMWHEVDRLTAAQLRAEGFTTVATKTACSDALDTAPQTHTAAVADHDGELRARIAQRLTDARAEAGHSQALITEQVPGLGRPALSDLERGKRDLSAIEALYLATIYRVPLDWLCGAPEAERTDDFGRQLTGLEPDDLAELDEFVTYLRYRRRRRRRRAVTTTDDSG